MSRLGNTRLLQSAPAGPWPGNKLCQAVEGGHRSMTAAISWRPQSGTTRIPAWLHTLPDSLSRLQPSIGRSLPQCQHHHQIPARVTVPLPSLYWYSQEEGAGCTFWTGNCGLCRVQQAGEAAPAPQLPTSRLPTRLLPPAPHAPNSPHACLSLTALANTWLSGHPLF